MRDVERGEENRCDTDRCCAVAVRLGKTANSPAEEGPRIAGHAFVVVVIVVTNP